MNKWILAGALAAMAVPSMADANSRHDRHERHERHERYDRHDRHDRHEWHGRRDHHGEWRHHHRHRAYVAPYRGWDYRPARVGHPLRPLFWGNRYVVDDYGRWGMGAPGHHRRWVRYGDDLLLVDIRTGRVLRIVRDRF